LSIQTVASDNSTYKNKMFNLPLWAGLTSTQIISTGKLLDVWGGGSDRKSTGPKITAAARGGVVWRNAVLSDRSKSKIKTKVRVSRHCMLSGSSKYRHYCPEIQIGFPAETQKGISTAQ